MSIVGIIPDNIARCMPKEDRKQFGKGGLTSEEAQVAFEARSEKKLQREIVQYLELKEIPYCNSRMDKKTTTKRGNPDFWICFNGRCITVECKVGGNKLTEEQEMFRRKIVADGGIHLTCSDLGQLKAMLFD